jgi:hypothetical protein
MYYYHVIFLQEMRETSIRIAGGLAENRTQLLRNASLERYSGTSSGFNEHGDASRRSAKAIRLLIAKQAQLLYLHSKEISAVGLFSLLS